MLKQRNSKFKSDIVGVATNGACLRINMIAYAG